MLNRGDGCLCWIVHWVSGLLLLSILSPGLQAQSPNNHAYFARKNTLGVFAAYSNNSSHILLGDAERRRLMQFGISYSRRMILNNHLNWQYDAEFMPAVLEGDPLTRFVNTQTSPQTGTVSGTLPYPMVKCAPITDNYNFVLDGITYSGTQVETCHGQRWTAGQAMSPLGMQLNYAPRNRWQPFVIAHGGYMYSTQAIPVIEAGSFNFTFDCGAGVEFFPSRSKSLRVEYRYHHFSNANSARSNPGVDNGLLQVTYAFWP